VPTAPESPFNVAPAETRVIPIATPGDTEDVRPLPPDRFWLGVGAVLLLGAAGLGIALLSAPSVPGAGPDVGLPTGILATPITAVPNPTPPLSPPAGTVTRLATAAPVEAVAPGPAPSSSTQPSATATTASGILTVRCAVDEHNPYWSQSTVTVTLTMPVNSLKVAVSIQQTGAVASTGTWSTIGSKAVASIRTGSTTVDYKFTLASGVTLPPGRYSFGVQYNHAAGPRSSAHDLYAVVAVASASGTQQGAGGHF
jgi:hypothetical protein